MNNANTYNPFRILTQLALLLMLSVFSLSVIASDKKDISNILSMSDAPDGVVFELIGSEDGKYLPNALRKIEVYKTQLKKKFPEIEVAVVAHGSEQFELTKDNAKKEKKSHEIVKRITADNVPVHICETHASWRGVGGEDFPDYVTVSSQGPTQIREYQNLGYLLVIVD